MPDPLRRSRVPRDLELVTTVAEEEDAVAAGMQEGGVERIWKGVEELYRSGIHPAIALCVRREGQVVLDRAIGHTRGNGPKDGPGIKEVLATPETPFCIFSASKAVTATLVHLLDERGVLHIDDRVTEYIPEYGRHGKEVITIAQVLSHRAGVPNLPSEALDIDNIGDEQMIVDILCDTKLSSRPGKQLAYHAISGGYIVAEVIRRITGKNIRDVLTEEIREPLGFHWNNYGVPEEDVPKVALAYPPGPPAPPPLSTLLKRALGRSADEVTEISNDKRFLTGIVPAGNVVTTANELSRFFEWLRLGGEIGGVRLIEPRTIRRALTEQSYRELDFTLGAPLRSSTGFMLGADVLSLYGPDTEQAFGHLGFTNIIAWADPARGLSVALLTSGKPTIYTELGLLWNLTRKIGAEAPKDSKSALAFA